MLIAEELFLLLTRDDGKLVQMGVQRPQLLKGAALAELILRERVVLDDRKDPKVEVVNPAPTGEDVLDALLARLVAKPGRRASRVFFDRAVQIEPAVIARLQATGVLENVEVKRWRWGQQPYPVRRTEPERQARTRLGAILRGGPASGEDGALLALVQAAGCAPKVFQEEAAAAGLKGQALKARIREAAGDCQAADAVKRSIDAMNAAVVTAAVVPVVIASGS